MKKIKINPSMIKIIAVSAGLTLCSLVNTPSKEESLASEPRITISDDTKSDEHVDFIIESYDDYFYNYDTIIKIDNKELKNYTYDATDSQRLYDTRIKYDNLVSTVVDLNELQSVLNEGKIALTNISEDAKTKYLNSKSYLEHNNTALIDLINQYQSYDYKKLLKNNDYIVINNQTYIVIVSEDNIRIVGDDGFNILIAKSIHLTDYQYIKIDEDSYFYLRTADENRLIMHNYLQNDAIIVDENDLSVKSKKVK